MTTTKQRPYVICHMTPSIDGKIVARSWPSMKVASAAYERPLPTTCSISRRLAGRKRTASCSGSSTTMSIDRLGRSGAIVARWTGAGGGVCCSQTPDRETSMRRVAALVVMTAVLPSAVMAQAHMTKDQKIADAVKAAPASISAAAAVMDWPATQGGPMTTLRAGTNGWTCLPDFPGTQGDDPMCVDDVWMGFMSAMMQRSEERRVGKECRSRWSPY